MKLSFLPYWDLYPIRTFIQDGFDNSGFFSTLLSRLPHSEVLTTVESCAIVSTCHSFIVST